MINSIRFVEENFTKSEEIFPFFDDYFYRLMLFVVTYSPSEEFDNLAILRRLQENTKKRKSRDKLQKNGGTLLEWIHDRELNFQLN